MTTLLTSLALLAGVASAQDDDLASGRWDQVHDLNCTDTQIDMIVRVFPVEDPRPESILYQDGSIEETHCLGALSPGLADVNRIELRDQCVFDGLDATLCEDLANDIVDQMVEMSETSPMDAFGIRRVEGDDAFGQRARLGILFEDDDTERWRAGIKADGHFLTPRVTSGAHDAGTTLECTERLVRFAHGLATDTTSRIERRNMAFWQCTDDAGTLDIEVRFNFKNRAVGGGPVPMD